MAKAKSEMTMDSRKRLYDTIQVCIPKGQRENVRRLAELHDESINHYINGLLRRELGMSATQWRHPNE